MPKIIFNQFKRNSRDELIQYCLHYQGKGKYQSKFAYIVPTIQMKELIESKFYKIYREASERSSAVFISPPIFLFTGFVNELLKDLGFYQKELGFYQKRIILKRIVQELLREGKIVFFFIFLSSEGFYSSLLEWLKEIKSAELTQESWSKLYAKSQKERELGYIYEKYERFLNLYSLVDLEKNYLVLTNQILKSKNSNSANNLRNTFLNDVELLIFDGFYQLSNLQLSLIQSLINIGKDVQIHLYYDPARSKAFPATTKLVKRIKNIEKEMKWQWEIEISKPVNIKTDSVALQYIAKNLFNHSATTIDCDDSIEIFNAPDRFLEVKTIASKIRQLLSSTVDLSFAEIAVVVPKIYEYRSIIAEVFSEFQIPFHFTRNKA